MNTMLRSSFVAVLLSIAPCAFAQSTSVSRRAERFPGRNELSAGFGFQAGMGGTTPGGFKMFFDYGYRISDLVWFNAKVNPAFSGNGHVLCRDDQGYVYDCGTGFNDNGNSIDLLAGIKLKFPVASVPLVPFVNLDGGAVVLYNRPYHDNGAAAPVLRTGGEINFTVGPAFYSQQCNGCGDSHSEFYRAFDLTMGVEFIL